MAYFGLHRTVTYIRLELIENDSVPLKGILYRHLGNAHGKAASHMIKHDVISVGNELNKD